MTYGTILDPSKVIKNVNGCQANRFSNTISIPQSTAMPGQIITFVIPKQPNAVIVPGTLKRSFELHF